MNVMIDDPQLESLAGKTFFEQGQALANQYKVTIQSQTDLELRAQVADDVVYTVHIDCEHHFHCVCSCAESRYHSVCQHGVAAVITVRDKQQACQDLQLWLAEFPVAELAKITYSLIAHDPNVYSRWVQKMTISQARLSVSELKPLIDDALPRVSIWNFPHVAQYFGVALEKMHTVQEAMQWMPLNEQWEVVEYAETRFFKALQNIEDTHNLQQPLFHYLQQQQKALFVTLDWDDNQKVDWLYARFTQQESLMSIPRDVECAELNTVIQLFLQRCRQALQQEEIGHDLAIHLADPLLKQATLIKDWAEQVHILSFIASRSADYLQMAKICLAHNDAREAKRWLTNAENLAYKHCDQIECVRVEIDICIALQHWVRAWNCVLDAFSGRPSFATFIALEPYCQILEQDRNEFVDWCEGYLFDVFNRAENRWLQKQSSAQLILFYLYLDKAQQAKDQADICDGPDDVMFELCEAVINEHVEWVFDRYFLMISQHIDLATYKDYVEANELIKRIEKESSGFKERERCYAMLIGRIKETYKRRRSMMALLNKKN